MELKDFRLVSAIFSEKTTIRAARVLGLTQSAVSHQLRSLEERLEIEVFVRKGRGLQITDAGEQIVALSKEVLPKVLSLEVHLTQGCVDKKTDLRIATQCYTAYHWLPQAMSALEAEHASIRIKIVPSATASPREALEAGELDLALCVDTKKDPRFCQKNLFSDELVLVTSPEHPLAKKSSVCGEDIAKEHLFLYELAATERARVHRLLFPEGGGFEQVTRLPLTEAICEMVRANRGVSILASWSVEPYVRRGELKCVRIGKKGIERKWKGAYPRDSTLVQPIRTLLRVLSSSGGPGTASGARSRDPSLPS